MAPTFVLLLTLTTAQGDAISFAALQTSDHAQCVTQGQALMVAAPMYERMEFDCIEVPEGSDF